MMSMGISKRKGNDFKFYPSFNKIESFKLIKYLTATQPPPPPLGLLFNGGNRVAFSVVCTLVNKATFYTKICEAKLKSWSAKNEVA